MYGSTDFPASMEGRWYREWRVSEVNTSGTAVDVGAVDVRFDLNDLGSVTTSDLRLLVDTDNDGVFADETPIAGATDLGGNIYQFAGVTALANNLRFTLGTINYWQTPLPVSLLNFEALVTEENKVELNWKTASEQGNAYFLIERSIDAKTWEEISRVKGAGNSSKIINYRTHDDQPFYNTSYYRLKQVDLNGNINYKGVESVYIELPSLSVFPNPGNQQVTVRGDSKEISSLRIFNSLGQEVSKNVQFLSTTDTEIQIDIFQLEPGFYLIKTVNTVSKFQKF